MARPITINHFRGEYRFLSNFSRDPVEIDGVRYMTAEHAYQAMKAVRASDRVRVASAPSPTMAKALGRRIACVPDWEQRRDEAMRRVLCAKFAPGSALAGLLVATYDAALVEGNDWHDGYWGVCNCGRPACCTQRQNRLGTLLMEVREALRGA